MIVKHNTEPFEHIHATNKKSTLDTIIYTFLIVASIIIVFYGLSLINILG